MCEDGGQRLRGCIYKQGIHRTGGNQQKLGERHGADSPSEPPGGTHTADTLILDFHLQRCERVHFYSLSHQVLAI